MILPTANHPCEIDDEFCAKLSLHKWTYGKGRNRCYYMTWMPDIGHVYLHRYVYEISHGPIPHGLDVDHEDRNPLNNCAKNLRAVTKSKNHANRGHNKGTLSGFRGVSLTKEKNKWRARHRFGGGKEVVLGIFNDPVSAAKAVNAAFAELFPDVSPPNIL